MNKAQWGKFPFLLVPRSEFYLCSVLDSTLVVTWRHNHSPLRWNRLWRSHLDLSKPIQKTRKTHPPEARAEKPTGLMEDNLQMQRMIAQAPPRNVQFQMLGAIHPEGDPKTAFESKRHKILIWAFLIWSRQVRHHCYLPFTIWNMRVKMSHQELLIHMTT